MKHLTADPRVDIVPEGFRQGIAKALRKDPEFRYRNVPEMVADLPWPEIAANSQKIISQHAIGPMFIGSPNRNSAHLANQHLDHSGNVEAKPVVAPTEDPRKKLPPVIISGNEIEVIPDIVFGPLTDNSHYQARPTSHVNRDSIRNVKSVPENHIAPAAQTAQPVRIIDNGVVAASPATASAAKPVPGSEPIAKAVHFGLSNLTQWWNHANFSTPVKIILLIIAGLVVVQNSQWLLPLVLSLGLVYLLYYLGRVWFTNPSEQPQTPSLRAIERQKTLQVRQWLAERPSGDRVTELVGSLLVGAFACIVLNLLGFAFGAGLLGAGVLEQGLDTSVMLWANYTWLTLNSIVGCWALLAISKNWESREGNSWLRRAAMISMGLLIGAIAFFSANSFEINLEELAIQDFQARESNQFVIRGLPIFPAYLIFFAGLFGILRWWRQTDPVRKTRLSLLNVALCLIWATVFSHLLNVPLTSSCMLAVVISVSVQLASPWLHPTNRDEVCHENPTNLPA